MRARHALLLLLALAAVLPAEARLGERLADLQQRFGKPQGRPQKNMQVWLIEEVAGPLLYTVTFDAQDRSIAEGLKPYRQAKLTEQAARNFIRDQLTVLADSNTARSVRPGENYAFAGQTFTCGDGEQVIVDEKSDLMIVWSQREPGSVLVVTSELVRRTAP